MKKTASIAELRHRYLSGSASPSRVVRAIFARIREEGMRPVWISLADEGRAVAQADHADLSLPLGGIPFAVKDNFDVAGMATTAGCPSFAFDPARTAPAVQRLVDAGAILIGKTNMDQFATGLVGVRSPYGACSSVFDPRYISGGSSSGSAVALAKGLCAFSLGTDTAGSGRVPAAFNDLIGLKPSRGLISTTGVVPACRSLDCVSIFAATASDAESVWRVACGFDAEDPYSRKFTPGAGASPWLPGSFRFGIPSDDQLELFGDEEAETLYRKAIERLAAIGGTPVTIDFKVFRDAADLLYSGPWVAERFAAVGDFLLGDPPDANPTVRNIILGGRKYSATDVFRSMYRLEELRRKAEEQWPLMDVLFLPTTGTTYTLAEVEADPVRLNTNLGIYTNFVNLMDLAAVAVPAGFRTQGMPFGVSIIGPAFSDAALLDLADRFLGNAGVKPPSPVPPGCVLLAVAGAHLSGQPLNHQLTDRGARLVRSCRTASEYRLYALPDSEPPKPALARDPSGTEIEIEVWAVPENQFGSFVAAVPPPLAIGSVRLDDGHWVKGFVCEPHAIPGAIEITQFGGWKNYCLR